MCLGLFKKKSISVFSLSSREAMVPSLHLLLLLWGLPGLWAQEHDYEEEVVTPRKKNRLSPSNSLPQNGKCKSLIYLIFFLHIFHCCSDRWAQLSLFPSPKKLLKSCCCHRWKTPPKKTRTSLKDPLISPGLLTAIHLLRVCSMLRQLNVLLGPNPVAPRGAFSL